MAGSPGVGGTPGTAGSAGGASGGKPGTGGTPAGVAGSGGSAPVGGSGGPSVGGSTGGNDYNPNFKEFYGDDCTVADPKDVNISTLPDLFEKLDGTKISKKSDWRCRRAELKKIVEKYIHGTKPGRPEKVTGTVSSTAIKVHVENGGKSIDFSVSVSLPSGTTGAVPIIIGMGRFEPG